MTVLYILGITSLFYALAYAYPCRLLSYVQVKGTESSLIKRSDKTREYEKQRKRKSLPTTDLMVGM